MTKIKKMLSVGLAGCMAVSALMMGAGAADTADSSQMAARYAKRALAAEGIIEAPDALSVYSGDSVNIKVMYCKADGSVVNKDVTVDIPTGATNAEMSQYTSESSAEAVGLPATKSIARVNDREIGRSRAPGGGNTITVPASTSEQSRAMMFTGTVPEMSGGREWDYLRIDFFNLAFMNTLNVRVENESLSSVSPNRNCYQTNLPVDSGTDLWVTFFENRIYGQGEFFITEGKNLTCYVSADQQGLGACIGYVGTNT